MGKVEIRVEKVGLDLSVYIKGSIDEDVDFGLYPLDGGQKISFYLAGITGINSCGIREWINWLKSAKATKIEFYECPKIIMDQINMVQNFLPHHSLIQSFYVPYFSEKSGEEKSVLFKVGKEYDNGVLHLPEEVKDSLGNSMEIDVVESKYFKFLKKSA